MCVGQRCASLATKIWRTREALSNSSIRNSIKDIISIIQAHYDAGSRAYLLCYQFDIDSSCFCNFEMQLSRDSTNVSGAAVLCAKHLHTMRLSVVR